MNFEYENQGHITYLSYSVSQNEIIDTMCLGMITNNKINGLAACVYTQSNMEKYIKYNVSAKIPVNQFFSGAVSKKRLLTVFDGIAAAMIAAEDYMIAIESLVLDLNYIFIDVSTCEVSLICLPVQRENAEPFDVNAFFKNIMFSTHFDQTENGDYIAKIINFLNAYPVFSISDFKMLIDEIKGNMSLSAPENINNTVVPAPMPIPAPMPTPIPTPMPVPNPIPVQTPKPASAPIAAANPVPAPMPMPNPVPAPMPKPVPKPMPKPVSMPMPGPAPMSQPPLSRPAMPQPPMPQQPMPQVQQKKKGGFFGLFKKKKKNQQPPVPRPMNGGNQNGFAIPGSVNGNNKFPVPAPAGQAFYPAGKPNGANSNIPGSVPVPNTPISNQSPRNIPPMPAPSPVPVQAPSSVPAPASAPVPTPQPAPQPVMAQGQHLNFGETTVLSGKKPGETTVLNGGAQPRQTVVPHLIRTKNGEKIYINKPFFRIGKEKSYVDYFIGDNTAVSRSHANIVTNNDKFFIVDTNSTNHTFVNGSMIQSNIETPISHGDKIRFGNEEFEFRLY